MFPYRRKQHRQSSGTLHTSDITGMTARDTPGDRQLDLRRVLFAANNP
jgi:hypothetical protein